jgi:membrane protease YdiL (CAAX protease family)
MFAELLASAAFGFVKGLYDKRGARAHSSFAGAVVEETLFRGLLPPAAGLAGFVASHRPKTAARAADVALGGLLYGSAMKRFGLLGAMCAHVAHNVCIGLGRRAK